MGCCYTRGSGLLVLANGLGGHPEGEVTALLVLQSISALLQNEVWPSIKGTLAFLSNALVAADCQIVHFDSQKGMRDSARTTLVACVLQATVQPWRTAVIRGFMWCVTLNC